MPGKRYNVEELQYAVRIKVDDFVGIIKRITSKIGASRVKAENVQNINTIPQDMITTSQQLGSSTPNASENANLMTALPNLLQESIGKGALRGNDEDVPNTRQDITATATNNLLAIEMKNLMAEAPELLQECAETFIQKLQSEEDEQDGERQLLLRGGKLQRDFGDAASPIMPYLLQSVKISRQAARSNMGNSKAFAHYIIGAIKIAIFQESFLDHDMATFTEIENDIQEFTSFPQSIRQTAVQIRRKLGNEESEPLKILRKISEHYFELVQKPACKFVHIAPLEEATRNLPRMKSFLAVDANELDEENWRQLISYQLIFGVILLHLKKKPDEFNLFQLNKETLSLFSDDPKEFPIVYLAWDLDKVLTKSPFMLSPLATIETNCDPGAVICQLSQAGKKRVVSEALKNLEVVFNTTVRDTALRRIRDFVVALGRIFTINGENVHGILKHLEENEVISAEGGRRLSVLLQYESTDNFGDIELISTMLICKDILQAYLSDGNNFEQMVSSSSFDTNDQGRVQEYFRDNSLLYVCNSKATAYLSFCTLYSVAIAVRYRLPIVLKYKPDDESWTKYISFNQGVFGPIFRNVVAKFPQNNDSTTELLCEPIFPLGIISMPFLSTLVTLHLLPEMISLFENRLNTLEVAIPENSFRLVSFEQIKRIMKLGKMALQHDGTPEYTKLYSHDFYSLFNEFANENLITDELFLQLRPLASDISLHFSEIFDLLLTTSFDLLRPKTILKRRLEKRISESANKTREIGSEGGDAEICGCLVKFLPQAVKEKTNFKLKVTSNPKKYPSGSNPISSILECSPSMRFDKPVTITMKTWYSSSNDIDSEAHVMSKKKGSEEWESIARFNLDSENVVTFSVKHFCHYCVVLTNPSRDQDYHITNVLYCKKNSGDIASVFYKDDKTKKDLQQSFREAGYKRISPAPENLLVREGMRITQEMEVLFPNDLSISCLPGNNIISVTRDVIKVPSFQTYFEFEQDLQSYQGLIRLRYWLKIIRENGELGDQPRGIPINLNWPEELTEQEPLQPQLPPQPGNALVYVAPESAVGSITIQHSTATSTVHSAVPVQQPQHLREQGGRQHQQEEPITPQQVEEHSEERPRAEPILDNPTDEYDRSNTEQRPQSSDVFQEREPLWGQQGEAQPLPEQANQDQSQID